MSRFRDFDWKKYGPSIVVHYMAWEGDTAKGTDKNYTIHVSFYNDIPDQVFGPYKNADRAFRDRMYLWHSRWKPKEKPVL